MQAALYLIAAVAAFNAMMLGVSWLAENKPPTLKWAAVLFNGMLIGGAAMLYFMFMALKKLGL